MFLYISDWFIQSVNKWKIFFHALNHSQACHLHLQTPVQVDTGSYSLWNHRSLHVRKLVPWHSCVNCLRKQLQRPDKLRASIKNRRHGRFLLIPYATSTVPQPIYHLLKKQKPTSQTYNKISKKAWYELYSLGQICTQQFLYTSGTDRTTDTHMMNVPPHTTDVENWGYYAHICCPEAESQEFEPAANDKLEYFPKTCSGN